MKHLYRISLPLLLFVFSCSTTGNINAANQKSNIKANTSTNKNTARQRPHGTKVKYFNNGSIQSEHLTQKTKINSILFAAKTQIKYYNTGEVYMGYLAKDHKIKGVHFSHVTLQSYLSDKINSGNKGLDALVNKWISNMRAAGMKGVYTPRFKLVHYPMIFYKNGQPKYGRLHKATTLQNILFYHGDFIYFYENGKVKSGTIRKKTTFAGKKLVFGDRIFLNKDGSLDHIEPGKYK